METNTQKPKKLEEIQKSFLAREYESERPHFLRYKETDVIDEKKDAEWNKAECIRLNDENKKAFEFWREETKRLYFLLRSDIINSVQYYYQIQQEKAEEIYDFCHNEWSDIIEMIYYIKRLTEFIQRLGKKYDIDK